MKSRKIICFLILSLLSIFLPRCKPEEIILHGEISGNVADALTSKSIQAATVTLSPSSDTTFTGSQGE